MRGKAFLAEGVEAFAEFTQALTLGEARITEGQVCIDSQRKRKGIEGARFRLARIVADTEPAAR